jgi:hypothetical protein
VLCWRNNKIVKIINLDVDHDEVAVSDVVGPVAEGIQGGGELFAVDVT